MSYHHEMTQGKDGRALLTRRLAAQKLAVSYAKVRELQTQGVLHGRMGPDGAWLYDQSELELVLSTVHRLRSSSREGEIQAAAVALMRKGASDPDLVVELRMTFAQARDIRRQYDPDGLWISGELVTRIRAALAESGRAALDASELAEQLEELAGRDRRLTSLELEANARPDPPSPPEPTRSGPRAVARLPKRPETPGKDRRSLPRRPRAAAQ